MDPPPQATLLPEAIHTTTMDASGRITRSWISRYTGKSMPAPGIENLLLSAASESTSSPGFPMSSSERGEPGKVSEDITSTGETSKNEICDDCRQIDFEKIINFQPTYYIRGIPIQLVGDRFRKRSPESCALCQLLFRHAKSELARWPDQGNGKLQAFDIGYFGHQISRSSKELLEMTAPKILRYLAYNDDGEYDQDDLRIGGSAVIYNRHETVPKTVNVLSVPADFDVSSSLSWLQYCIKNHRKLCSNKASGVDGLELVDCETLLIKQAQAGDLYTALSYVWGSSDCDFASESTGGGPTSRRLPAEPPAVILDAIKVTKLLGFKYIWIDKFCIDQENHAKKQEQIRQMDRIYQNSELVIINAAGAGENCGLPGVGSTQRRVQHPMEIGNYTVIPSLADPHRLIYSSKWYSRGWTFQEAILSRRRLVFTAEQVYFECNAMNCCESLHVPLDIRHTEDKSKQRRFFRDGLFGGYQRPLYRRRGGRNHPPMDTGFSRYQRAIEQYTCRELRYDRDSINGFLGVTRMFEKAQNPYFHVWGLPYGTSNIDNINHNFAYSLSWSHETAGYKEGVGREIARQRPDFPSWSWCGWGGPIYFPASAEPEEPAVQFKSVMSTLHLEYEDEDVVSLTQLAQHARDGAPLGSFPRMLTIESDVISLAAFTYNSESDRLETSGFRASITMSPTDLSYDSYSDLQNADRFQCIAIYTYLDSLSALVLEIHDGYASRAGILSIHGSYEKGGTDIDQLLKSPSTVKKTFRII